MKPYEKAQLIVSVEKLVNEKTPLTPAAQDDFRALVKVATKSAEATFVAAIQRGAVDWVYFIAAEKFFDLEKTLHNPGPHPDHSHKGTALAHVMRYAYNYAYDGSIRLAEGMSMLGCLIGMGVNLNAKPRHFAPALHQAADKPTLAPFVALLLRSGADPSMKNNYGQTALHIAAFRPCQGPMYELLAHSTKEIHVEDPNGDTPLTMGLSYYIHAKEAEHLIFLGADIYHTNRQNKSGAYLMRKKSENMARPEIAEEFKILCEKACPPVCQPRKKTPGI